MKKDIKKKLIEIKEKKNQLIVEQEIVENRIMMIFENKENIKNFENLPEEKKQKIAKSLMREISLMGEQEILSEQLGDFLKGIFGNSLQAVAQTMVEPLVNSILKGLGMENSFFSKFLTSFIITRPGKLLAAFRDCKAMTELVALALSEAMVQMVQEAQGLQGAGYTILRNALGGALQDTPFIKKLMVALEDFVCKVYHSLTGKAEKVYTNLSGKETTAQTAPSGS